MCANSWSHLQLKISKASRKFYDMFTTPAVKGWVTWEWDGACLAPKIWSSLYLQQIYLIIFGGKYTRIGSLYPTTTMVITKRISLSCFKFYYLRHPGTNLVSAPPKKLFWLCPAHSNGFPIRKYGSVELMTIFNADSCGCQTPKRLTTGICTLLGDTCNILEFKQAT